MQLWAFHLFPYLHFSIWEKVLNPQEIVMSGLYTHMYVYTKWRQQNYNLGITLYHLWSKKVSDLETGRILDTVRL